MEKHVRKQAAYLCDLKVLAILSKADMTAIETVYHKTCLKVMKRAASCKHRQAVKNIQCEKKLFKSLWHSSKLGKRVEKHGTSTNQKMN